MANAKDRRAKRNRGLGWMETDTLLLFELLDRCVFETNITLAADKYETD